MQISVKSDVDKAVKSMRGLQRKRVLFAAAPGLTMTAKKVTKVEQRMMVRKLDRPPPFTIKGVRWQWYDRSIRVEAACRLRKLHPISATV